MADQLSLRLEADQLPDLPDLRPMLPRPLPAPFDSDEHLFEPWWGGERAIVSVGPADLPGTGDVVVRDASGRDVTAVLPELAGLAVRIAARSAILDGELVVVDASGRADPGRAGAPAGRRAGAASGVPGVRPAASRRPVAAVAAPRPAPRSAAPGPPAGRRGGGRAGHRDRGDRPVRGGRRPGDRRASWPASGRVPICPGPGAGCGDTWRRRRWMGRRPRSRMTPRGRPRHRSSR